jgi:hypothetical protein
VAKGFLLNYSQTTNDTSGSIRKGNVVIKISVENQTLTSVMQDPGVITKVDPESFFEEYKAVTADTDGRNAPATVIMIHLDRGNTVAARVAGGIVTLAISFAARLLDALVIGD